MVSFVSGVGDDLNLTSLLNTEQCSMTYDHASPSKRNRRPQANKTLKNIPKHTNRKIHPQAKKYQIPKQTS